MGDRRFVVKLVVIIAVLVLSALAGVASAALGDGTEIDVELLPTLLQAVAFGGAAPGLAYLFIDWLKVQIPPISPYATRNAALVISGLFGLAAWGFLMLIQWIEPPPPVWHVWLRYAVSIIGSSGTMGQFIHGAVKLDRVRVPEA